jgi:Beta-galactosidase/beta-glucuronidase
MKRFPFIFLLSLPLSLFAQHRLSLAGIWKFKTDPFFTGISANGVQLMPQLAEEIMLPGSTDQAGKGIKTHDMTSLRLTRMYEYKGPAWYEKEVFVPASWSKKNIRLYLERAHWETAVWINSQPAGKQESLSVPHIYDITRLLQPDKKNVIRIRVDNNLIYNIEYSHAVSAETQTNWNGIIGKIELLAADKVNVHDVQVYPQAAKQQAEVRIQIANPEKHAVQGTLQLKAQSTQHKVAPVEVSFSGTDSIISVTTQLNLGANMQTWDEFHPNLYNLQVQLNANGGAEKYADSSTVVFGVRDFKTDGTRFTINNRPVFIRSTVNCAEFPLTGYPAMDTASWGHIFRISKAYGLNGMRFHSWCPPKAAFEVADRMGFYLQVENSDWRFTIGKDSAVNRFLKEESFRILDTYGNHPSFVMMCEGNELVGPTAKQWLGELVTAWKKKDPRHLYTGGSGYPVIPEAEFHDFYGPRPQRWKEGLKGRFNKAPLNTQYDYATDIKKFKEPLMSHEVGQWCVYPDFDEIPKFSGVLRAYNYELFRESLREHHMLDQAPAFTMASGKWQVLQKKEEIESYLRTPGMAGYTLLQLNDFPGQGTAPVGVVDVFWQPKKYVTGAAFSRFQNAVVPLLRTDGFTYTNRQHFTAHIDLANFGEAPLNNATISWSLRYPDGTVYEQGRFANLTIPLGSPIKTGSLNIPLNRVQKATRLLVSAQVEGTPYQNDWNIWVYPETLPQPSLKNIVVARSWNDAVKKQLQKGATVLLLPDTGAIQSTADPVFSGISWNTVWSGMPPNLLGILCDPDHVALREFPTEFHTNWQWWDVVRHSKPFVLDHTPAEFRPLIQMIPDWNLNNKIGLVCEAKVGKGKLLLSAIDLVHDLPNRPVARQLLYSLQQYVSSPHFNPAIELPTDMIDALFKR